MALNVCMNQLDSESSKHRSFGFVRTTRPTILTGSNVCSWCDLSKCADREAAMFSGILEAVVANPPHIMNIIRGFIAFYGFTVTFNDDIAFT